MLFARFPKQVGFRMRIDFVFNFFPLLFREEEDGDRSNENTYRRLPYNDLVTATQCDSSRFRSCNDAIIPIPCDLTLLEISNHRILYSSRVYEAKRDRRKSYIYKIMCIIRKDLVTERNICIPSESFNNWIQLRSPLSHRQKYYVFPSNRDRSLNLLTFQKV